MLSDSRCASVPPIVNLRLPLTPVATLLALLRGLCLLVALVAVGVALPSAGAALDLPSMRSDGAPAFDADVAVAVDPDGTPGLAVSVTLAYPDLQWLKTPDGFAARFEVLAVFEPVKGNTQYGDTWQRQLRLSTFDQTTVRASTILERRTFRVPPGRYRLRVRLRDLNSEMESRVGEALEVPDYSKVPLALAELELGTLGAGGLFQPNPARLYGYDSDHLAARVGIIDRRAGNWPRSYSLRYRVLDETGQEVVHGDRTVGLERTGGTVLVRPDSAGWFVGKYTLSLELDDGRSHWRNERTFEVEESGPPRGQDYRRMLEPIAYIAEGKELDELSHATDATQAAAWEAFWKRRDPTPDTARNEALIEFLRRVRYSDQHFQHFGPGWRSDMGRIYIKFGPPDQIESRVATIQSPPVEIWIYNRPARQFVFTDRQGFGRYEMIGPGGE